MTRKIKLVVLLLLIASVIIYIEGRIAAYDMRFYAGKDDGLFARLESIWVMCSLFFLVMSEQKRILMSVIGFVIGFLSPLLTYLILALTIGKYITYSQLFYYIVACLVFVKLFFVVEKKLLKITRNGSESKTL